jgi:hypothetical protein
MKNRISESNDGGWPEKPNVFPDLVTPLEAAMFLRLETSFSPQSARRTLDYWRDKGELRATKYSRRVWYLKDELQAFLRNKNEQDRNKNQR